MFIAITNKTISASLQDAEGCRDENPVRWTEPRKVGRLGLSTLLRFFAPRILERDRPIEHRLPLGGFRIHTEIAKALELVAHIRRSFF